jgi:hypothetical protein
MATAQRVVERTALHAVAATADMAATGTVRIHPRPITRWEVSEAVEAASRAAEAAQDQGGRQPVRP